MHKIMGHLDEPTYMIPPTMIRRESYETESSVEWDADESEESLSFHGGFPQHLLISNHQQHSSISSMSAKPKSILVLTPNDLIHRVGEIEESDSEDVFGNYDVGHDDDDETDDHSISLDSIFVPAQEQRSSIITTISTTQLSSSKPLNRSVGFADVRVRNYAVTVGDLSTGNDSCPLALDWDYSRDESFGVDQYEQLRTGASTNNVRKLTVEQRRKRIAQVKGWDERLVRALEIERVMSNIEETLQRSNSTSNDSSSSSSSMSSSPPLCPDKWLDAPPSSPTKYDEEELQDMDEHRRILTEGLEVVFNKSEI